MYSVRLARLFLSISEYLCDFMSHAAAPELGADRKRKRDSGGTLVERGQESPETDVGDCKGEKITWRRDETRQR